MRDSQTPRHDPDLALLQAVADGDGAACRQLVDRHLTRLHALAARMLGDAAEAEDVCQDTFLKLWQFAPRWQAERALISTWLYQVVLNACRDRLRRARPLQDEIALETAVAGEPAPAAQLEQQQRAEQLRRAIDTLPERQREALLLFHFEGRSQSEAAAILEVSEDALESLLARARRGLREQLAGP